MATVTPNQTIYVPVQNTTKQYVTLHAGVLLGHYEPTEDQKIERAEDFNTNPETVGCLKTHIKESIGPDSDGLEGNWSRREKLERLLQERDWSHLTPEQQDRLFPLIFKHENTFIVEPKELGLLKL